jgi:Second Messenger Oligonucleotide or Dinucleotide Synthetase domain
MQKYFLKLKSNLELDPTLAEKITTRHSAVRTYLKNNHPGFKDSQLIGSLQRQTRINPGATHRLDIDIMVIVGEFHNWVTSGGITAHDAIRALHSTVNQSARYGAMEPAADPPTVTLTSSDGIEVQLVPAYIDMIGADSAGNILGEKGRGYWVAKNGTWTIADYDHEAAWISAQNRESNGLLIPTLKMLKVIKRVYFPILDSFPLEILAAKIIPGTVLFNQRFGGAASYQTLLHTFFELAPRELSTPIRVPGSKSAPIILDHLAVNTLTTQFAEIAHYIKTISALSGEAQRAQGWRTLCGEFFPSRLYEAENQVLR